jgi:hypothetical protein
MAFTTASLFWEVRFVRRILQGFCGLSLALAATAAWSADITWNGSASANVTTGANWNGGTAPGPGDVAIIGGSPQAPDFGGQSVTWGKVNLFVANNIADTGGGGVLNLTGSDDSQLFSAGDLHLSTIAVDIVATKNIQTNGTHSVTFNGDVTARKVEAFGGSVATFNGIVTQTDEFMSIGGGSKIVINNEFHRNNANHGINNSPVIELGAGAKFFRTGNVPGLDVFNLYNGSIVRLLADNALGTSGETDIWSRNTTNTFDMNGNDQFVEFFGMCDSPAALNIDFGSAPGVNTLIWDASHGMNGTGLYSVLNFQSGDTLEFGQHGADGGFHNPAILARIRVNGAAYAASNPGTGPWWSLIPTPNPGDDPGRQIVVYHVPEPTGLAMFAAALLGIAFRRGATVLT